MNIVMKREEWNLRKFNLHTQTSLSRSSRRANCWPTWTYAPPPLHLLHLCSVRMYQLRFQDNGNILWNVSSCVLWECIKASAKSLFCIDLFLVLNQDENLGRALISLRHVKWSNQVLMFTCRQWLRWSRVCPRLSCIKRGFAAACPPIA